jgi:hypothetical protein
MDKPKPPIFTNHQRKRLTLWALTVLGWLASVLFGDRDAHHRHFAQRLHHIGLDHLTRVVITLVIARALQFAKVRTRRRLHYSRHGRSLRRAHFIRSLLGARLRRQLRHKDFATRIAQLTQLLRNLDQHARHLAQRLRRLRRLWREVPAIAPAALMLGPPAPSPALADSS